MCSGRPSCPTSQWRQRARWRSVRGIFELRRTQSRVCGCCGCVLGRGSTEHGQETTYSDGNAPRCSWRSFTSSVSPPLCFASRHPKLVTESMNSSAISRSSYSRFRVRVTTAREMERTSSTSGSILTFGSILDTRSCMDLRMLWSPGVFFRRVRLSSRVSTAESSGFAICGGAPVGVHDEPLHRRRLLCTGQTNAPETRPPGSPPVSDGLPC